MNSNRQVHIITLDITTKNQVVSIDERLPSHIRWIDHVHVNIMAPFETEQMPDECGEITLANFGTSFFHAGCYLEQRVDLNSAFRIYHQPGLVLTGFYKDLGRISDQQGNFLPYKIRIYLGYEFNG